MKMKIAFVAMLVISVSNAATNFESKYIGEENRQIKGLSQEDINELQRGGGWGLAKSAELNGMPGPVHILEMGDRIHLSNDQRKAIEALYNEMKSEAIPLGDQLIKLETDLDTAFSDKTITMVSLSDVIGKIENTRAKLRVVHLSAHLQTPDILSADQVALYNQLRGYSQTPCENIPEGHSIEMWKKHNGCK